jgi:hypothetical protein
MVRFNAASILMFSALSATTFASGPGDRVPTDPKSVVSVTHDGASPVNVADILQTTRIGGATLSPNGSQIAYIGNAFGPTQSLGDERGRFRHKATVEVE